MYQHNDIEIGLFQLLPRDAARDDAELIEQALADVDYAEANGFDSVWVTEHHFSEIGSIGAPSVYAAAIAQRTRRIRVGYGVAVVPLHHPLRLAEEISWVDHLSGGRVMVGFGAGFSPTEFGGFGVPIEERHERLREGAEIVRRALSEPEIEFEGKYWRIPRVSVFPRPRAKPHPPFYRAVSSDESLREAAAADTPILFGTKPLEELRASLELYRTIRAGMGIDDERIETEIAQMYVLRKIDGHAEQLLDLHEIGIRKVIGWFDSRRSMTAMAEEVLPRVREATTSSLPPACARSRS
jgi:alkanesulfonate monooxygenase SsuD/methylene tetrahydromethanopterin reductase-like flavin-dependent oxidoreductase (luciferase family)